jgi:hypothetical protein
MFATPLQLGSRTVAAPPCPGRRARPSGRERVLGGGTAHFRHIGGALAPLQQRQRQQAPLTPRRRLARTAPRASATPSPSPSQQQQQQQQLQKVPASGHITNVVSTAVGEIKLGSFLSRQPDALGAVQEAVAAIRAGLGGEAFQPELALVFATAAYGDGLEEVVPALRQLAPSLRHVFGCTVLGGGGGGQGGRRDGDSGCLCHLRVRCGFCLLTFLLEQRYSCGMHGLAGGITPCARHLYARPRSRLASSVALPNRPMMLRAWRASASRLQACQASRSASPTRSAAASPTKVRRARAAAALCQTCAAATLCAGPPPLGIPQV